MRFLDEWDNERSKKGVYLSYSAHFRWNWREDESITIISEFQCDRRCLSCWSKCRVILSSNRVVWPVAASVLICEHFEVVWCMYLQCNIGLGVTFFIDLLCRNLQVCFTLLQWQVGNLTLLKFCLYLGDWLCSVLCLCYQSNFPFVGFHWMVIFEIIIPFVVNHFIVFSFKSLN